MIRNLFANSQQTKPSVCSAARFLYLNKNNICGAECFRFLTLALSKIKERKEMECWGDGAKSVEMTASHYDDKSFFKIRG